MLAELRKLLEKSNRHPFLFVGSGFTRRYLGFDDWKGLVSRFAEQAMPDSPYAYQYYKNQFEQIDQNANEEQILPAVTQKIEKDFNDRFFTDQTFRNSVIRDDAAVRADVSPFKTCVADWFISQEPGFANPDHAEEISAIGHSRKNVAGIITTNFDRYLESLFPDHTVYIGQNELLFHSSYGVGELYKIHGCVSKPESMVLTQLDYDAYVQRNAYLSAKLLTLFIEHPIFFFGYSLNDSNIRLIFNDIANCLNAQQLQSLSQRIFFVQRAKEGRVNGISTTREYFGDKVIEFKQVVTDDFSIPFKAIAAMHTRYSPKVLRQLKKDIYELVLSNDPNERIAAVDIGDSTKFEEIEYVMGIGVRDKITVRGYAGIDVVDLIEDLIIKDASLDADLIVSSVLEHIGKQCSFNLPVFKYCEMAANVDVPDSVREYIMDVQSEQMNYWVTNSMRKDHKRRLMRMKETPWSTFQDLQNAFDCTTSKGAAEVLKEIAFLPREHIELDALHQFLGSLYTAFSPILTNKEHNLSTYFRKAVRIYDWLKYGQKKAPLVPKETETR